MKKSVSRGLIDLLCMAAILPLATVASVKEPTPYGATPNPNQLAGMISSPIA